MKLSHIIVGAFIVGITGAIATELVERFAFKHWGPKS